jgi:hypothetical protein
MGFLGGFSDNHAGFLGGFGEQLFRQVGSVLYDVSRLDLRRFAALIPTFKLPRRVRSLGS